MSEFTLQIHGENTSAHRVWNERSNALHMAIGISDFLSYALTLCDEGDNGGMAGIHTWGLFCIFEFQKQLIEVVQESLDAEFKAGCEVGVTEVTEGAS